ncbi:MAG: hypothetical protein L6U99_14320 [Clostridium sp.]|nr:MAG: hypothetical protein L6U99_14320 [Clostridium sp.]
MAEALTNYYFAKDLITNIQDKYKVLGNITDAKKYFYIVIFLILATIIVFQAFFQT